MNREIKFRAWDLSEKSWVSNLAGSIRRKRGMDDYFVNDEPYYEFNRGDIELMQYTGLKDKNGVEIYEGDIVISHADYNGKGKYPKTVKYDNYFTGWFPLHSQGWQGGLVEVIGNIYENEELLGIDNE